MEVVSRVSPVKTDLECQEIPVSRTVPAPPTTRANPTQWALRVVRTCSADQILKTVAARDPPESRVAVRPIPLEAVPAEQAHRKRILRPVPEVRVFLMVRPQAAQARP